MPTTDAAIVAVTGELDISAVPGVERKLRAAAGDAQLVVLDLRGLEFVDASGAALMLAADRQIRRTGGRMLVARGSGDIQWLLALMGVERELEFVEAAGDVAPGRPV